MAVLLCGLAPLPADPTADVLQDLFRRSLSYLERKGEDAYINVDYSSTLQRSSVTASYDALSPARAKGGRVTKALFEEGYRHFEPTPPLDASTSTGGPLSPETLRKHRREGRSKSKSGEKEEKPFDLNSLLSEVRSSVLLRRITEKGMRSALTTKPRPGIVSTAFACEVLDKLVRSSLGPYAQLLRCLRLGLLRSIYTGYSGGLQGLHDECLRSIQHIR